MENKLVKFDNSQRQTPEIRKHTSHKKKKQQKQPKIENSNKFSIFFSKGWNIVRFFFFLAVIVFLLSVLLSTFSSIPEGKSFTWSLFINQLRETLGIIGFSSSIVSPIYEKLSKILTEGNFKFLFFLSFLFFTIGMLVCFCP